MNFTSNLTFSGNARDPDVVYYNATLVNNNTAAGTQDDPIVVFKETKDSPILNDTSQYEMAVRKVLMSGAQKTLPIFIPQIEIVQQTDASGVTYTTIPDVNKTVYEVTFGLLFDACPSGTANRSYTYSRNITWITENVNAAVPRTQVRAPSPVGSKTNLPLAQQEITDYYYGYTYNHWLICLNNALTLAWQDATNAAVTDLTASGFTSSVIPRCPRFEYDEVTKLFSLYCDVNSSASPQVISGGFQVTSFVGMNTNLEGLMTNFDTQYYGDSILINSTLSVPNPTPAITGPYVPQGSSITYYPENIIAVRNKSGTNIQLSVDPSTGLGYTSAPSSRQLSYITYVITQDFQSTGSLWSPIADIVLTTTSIPVRNEFVTAPSKFGFGNLGSAAAQGTAIQAVICDFQVQSSQTSDDFRGYLKYEPNIHKIVKLAPSKDELKSIDIQVWWKYRLTNELIPLRIYNLGTITVQLMFRRIGQDA